MTQASISDAALLCFDTNALICLVERVPPYHAWLATLFESIDTGDRLAVVSAVTEAEARVQPLRRQNLAMLRKFEATLAHRNVRVAPVDREVARRAGSLRAQLDLALPDALIVATAIIEGCDAIVGNDATCARRVKEIPYIYLDEAVAR